MLRNLSTVASHHTHASNYDISNQNDDYYASGLYATEHEINTSDHYESRDSYSPPAIVESLIIEKQPCFSSSVDNDHHLNSSLNKTSRDLKEFESNNQGLDKKIILTSSFLKNRLATPHETRSQSQKSKSKSKQQLWLETENGKDQDDDIKPASKPSKHKLVASHGLNSPSAKKTTSSSSSSSLTPLSKKLAVKEAKQLFENDVNSILNLNHLSSLINTHSHNYSDLLKSKHREDHHSSLSSTNQINSLIWKSFLLNRTAGKRKTKEVI